MKILIVSVEVAPFAKVGGLADVAGALPKALQKLGHDVRLAMPLYKMIEDDARWTVKPMIDKLDVTMGSKWSKTAVVKQTDLEGVPVMLIGTDQWFPLSVDSASVYQPGGMQHVFLSQAILTACEELNWIPDVIHCNDWHTGFLPVILREKATGVWDRVASIYTIHNLAYQGEFGIEVLDALDLPHSLFNPNQLETYGRVNFLKAGAVFSDRVNTVSPNYAREILTPQYGCRLEGLMQHLAMEGRLSGILNGIDTDVFDPATDPDLPFHFSAESPENKAKCRAALLKELKMKPIEGAPVIGMVSRLSSQKGMDMVLESAESMLSLPTQLVVQGLGEPDIAEGFRQLEKRFPKQVRFIERFDAPLAERVYAGCDAFLMPSKFEPCGLGQLIAMRYGTVPVVRSTGGLADTVFDGLNGFVFHHQEPMEMLAAIERMQCTFEDPTRWTEIQSAGMHADFGWAKSALAYEDLYDEAISDRRGESRQRTA
jgi:starch synthase